MAAAAAAAAVFFYLLAFWTGEDGNGWGGQTLRIIMWPSSVFSLSARCWMPFHQGSSSICPSCLNCRSPSRAETQPNQKVQGWNCFVWLPAFPSAKTEKDGSTSIPLDVSLPKFSSSSILCDNKGKQKMFLLAGLSVLGFVLFPFGRFFRKIPDCCGIVSSHDVWLPAVYVLCAMFLVYWASPLPDCPCVVV